LKGWLASCQLAFAQNSNALPALWLEGRFCAVTYPICCFSSGGSQQKKTLALPRENRKKTGLRL
jgi:hypothetical protein